MNEIFHEFFINKVNKGYKAKVYAYHIGAFNYNWHDYVECLFVINGKIEASIDGKIYKLTQDDMCFIDSSLGHATLSKEKDTIAIVLHFDPRVLENYIPKNSKVHIKNKYIDKNSYISKSMRRSMAMLVDSFDKDSSFGEMKRDAAIYNILYLILENFSIIDKRDEEPSVQDVENEVIKELITYLKNNYNNKIYLDDLANLVGYHPNYTSEIFSRIVGMPFTEFLRRYRLSQATKELKSRDKTISDIALRNGFSNVRSFNSYFKETFKRTPSSYRNSLDQTTKDIDAEFKKIFLDKDTKCWQDAKIRWLTQEESDNEIDIEEIKKKVKQETIDEIIDKIKSE